MKTEYDSVHLVKHYQITENLEAIDLIRIMATLSDLKDPFNSHCYCTALKYLLRLNRKGSAKEDVGKAIRYLQWLEERLED